MFRSISFSTAAVIMAVKAGAQQLQPSHNTLAWTDCGYAPWRTSLGLNPEEEGRMTGGCAKLTFCKRTNDYEDYKFGYDMHDGSGCLSPGPIIRMEPGKTYGLVFCSDGGAGHPGSNIHTHGPHISGAGNSDDITRHIYANSCGFYEYAISSDHMGGTNWYHPHLHFHTEEQASGGAFGFLVIEDRGQDETVDPSVGTAQQRADVYDFLTDSTRELFLLAAFNSESETWVNKNQDSNSKEYNLVANTWYRIRILTVNPDAEPETISIPTECEAHALAHDGAYRFEPPKANQPHYFLTGASRLDLAIKCNSPGSYDITNTEGWDGRRLLRRALTSWGDSGGWVGSPAIATLHVADGVAPSATGPFLLDLFGDLPWKSYRPDYLQDLRGSDVDNTWSLEMSDSSVNGLEYSEYCPLKDGGADFDYGTVQQFTLQDVDDHPSHMHVYHQQVVTNCGPGHDIGEYYDTIAAATGSSNACKVRFKIIDVHGRIVIHCHILKHEDAGTMAWINVRNGRKVTPTSPCCLSGTCSECVDEENLPDNCAGDDDDYDDS